MPVKIPKMEKITEIDSPILIYLNAELLILTSSIVEGSCSSYSSPEDEESSSSDSEILVTPVFILLGLPIL